MLGPMRTILLAVALAALSSACSGDHASTRVTDGDARQLLYKRVWLDEEPRTESQRFHVLVFDKRKSGIYQDRTIWKGAFELFRYKADGSGLSLELPGSDREVKTGYKIERVKHGQADVRLTIDKPADGPSVYYGYRFDGAAVDADAWVTARFGSIAE